ncbi:hypothetical protein BKA24_000390 [Microbacterium marinum]|uniref:Uncharacterized protein n=1 Tax=Microbacterium marinum TaxID=421115 RepID=A0A7W7BN26_9MICO|nr:hypothetical protein [Microbacterium marinum]
MAGISALSALIVLIVMRKSSKPDELGIPSGLSEGESA